MKTDRRTLYEEGEKEPTKTEENRRTSSKIKKEKKE